ncbi:FHA domain-containing protein [bacterium]|nr:FHA domain-containing protein [candidate division CSSED10-310 bacterium]
MSKKKAEQPEFLSEVSDLQEQIESLKKRLELVEENREKVRQKIYEKVKSDYEKNLQELYGKLEPFKEKIEYEILSLEEQIQKEQTIVEDNQEELEEFQLRFFAGEFGEDEFTPQQNTLISAIENAKSHISEIQHSIAGFKQHMAFITGEPIEEEPVMAEEVLEEPPEEAPVEPVEEEDFLSDGQPEKEIYLEDEQLEELEEELVESTHEHDFQPEQDEIDLSAYETSGERSDHLMKDTVNETLFPAEGEVAEPIEVQPENEEDYIWNSIPVLDVVDGDFTGESYTIDKERITMGRGPNNDIQLATDTSVSRHHAQIVLEGNKYFLVDLDSSNGSSVNGIRVSRAALRPNDEITIGVSKMIIRAQD